MSGIVKIGSGAESSTTKHTSENTPKALQPLSAVSRQPLSVISTLTPAATSPLSLSARPVLPVFAVSQRPETPAPSCSPSEIHISPLPGISAVNIQQKHKPVALKPESNRLTRAQSVAIEWGKFFKFLDRECQAFKLFLKVNEMQLQRRFPPIGVNFLPKDSQVDIEAFPETGIIAIPKSQRESLHLSHFIYGLLITADHEKITELNNQAKQGRLKEAEFVQKRARVHYKTVETHSRIIKQLF
jgi:hypothetical protein